MGLTFIIALTEQSNSKSKSLYKKASCQSKKVSNTKKWSDEEIDKLIGWYKAKPSFWDIFDKDYYYCYYYYYYYY